MIERPNGNVTSVSIDMCETGTWIMSFKYFS